MTPSRLQRRTRLKRVSAKRKKQQAARLECCRVVYVRSRCICELRLPNICTRGGVHVHEIVSRARGGSIIDPANCLMACAACHSFVHDFPAAAERLGLLRHSWDAKGATT